MDHDVSNGVSTYVSHKTYTIRRLSLCLEPRNQTRFLGAKRSHALTSNNDSRIDFLSR